MCLSLIAAMAPNRVIGLRGTLPWRLPSDLKHFKRITLNKPVLMGRKTWDSLQVQPLPGRDNFILTRNSDFKADGAAVVHSLEEALALVVGPGEIMVIGGEEVYRLALPWASCIYLTEVQGVFEGDTHFPELDSTEWREVSRKEHGAEGASPAYSLVILKRMDSVSA